MGQVLAPVLHEQRFGVAADGLRELARGDEGQAADAGLDQPRDDLRGLRVRALALRRRLPAVAAAPELRRIRRRSTGPSK